MIIRPQFFVHFFRKQKIAIFAAQKSNAVVAQLVEHQLPKLRVASSSLVCRSKKRTPPARVAFFIFFVPLHKIPSRR
jgi:hypothetical protein